MSIDENQQNTKGVAFIINKKMVKWNELRHRTLIPGQAITLKIPWHNNTTICCLNVYAPNKPNKNKRFWKSLKSI